MEIVNYYDLKNIKNLNYGSYSYVYSCLFDDKVYAFKEYSDYRYLYGKKRKLNNLSKNVTCGNLILPKYFVKKDDKTIGILTEFSNFSQLDKYDCADIKTKIMLLKKVKETIENMHKEGIIHTDLHEGNILADDASCGVNIIDFDNASYKGSEIKIDETNEYSQDFIRYYGLTNEVDTFIFNLVTYMIINESRFYSARYEIAEGKYGLFNDNKEAKKICDSLLLNDKVANKDYLIDTIDESILRR